VTERANPYAHALDGLVIEDPVAAFFDFCRSREQIRIRRQSGMPAPWSGDPIFQKGRFLNVFREDDRVSQSIIRFAEPLTGDLNALVQAVFFARWCNKAATLDQLSSDMLADPGRLAQVLECLPDQPWCNVTAYPVEPVLWEQKRHSRLDTATHLFGQVTDFLVEAVCGARGSVIRATDAINQRFSMANDFPIFMAVIDLAWFRPDVIDPGSPVPTGIGAVAFLDRLQRHLGLASHQATCERMIALQTTYWPEARRAFQPIDIEYLSCECRKYYSYINGTKQFEGKNLFVPGRAPSLVFDIDSSRVPNDVIQTRVRVLAGGPCAGKTTLLEALARAGHRAVPETAEVLLKGGITGGHTAEEQRCDPVEWQMELLRQDFELFDRLPADQAVFTDTSIIETVVYAARAGISMGPNMLEWLRRRRFEAVYFLDSLEDYERSDVRTETASVAGQISAEVHRAYRQQGYVLQAVPCAPIEQRLDLVRATVKQACK
jgi:predicted ATPase